MSAANSSTTIAEPPEPDAEQVVVPGDTTGGAPSTSVATDADQSVVSQKQKKRRKHAGAGQSDSTPADSSERHAEASAEPVGALEPPQTEPSKTKKRKKTVVLDLPTVIPSSAAAQVRLDPSICETVNLWNALV